MSRHITVAILLIASIANTAQAPKKSQGVVDVGNAEVVGGVRKPMIDLIESDRALRAEMIELARKRFHKLETEVLDSNDHH